MLYDESGVDLRIVAAVGCPPTSSSPPRCARATASQGGSRSPASRSWSRTCPDGTRPLGPVACARPSSVPIADTEGVLGVLNVGSSDHPSRFTATDLETLEALAHQTAVALRNARAVASASDLYFDTLKALALAIEMKDPYAHGGTDRVMHYTSLLAAEMGLPAHETRALEIAAMLHDIGMPSAARRRSPPTGRSQPWSTVSSRCIR
jgi:hypothetical protein